jgi:ATP-binding cassette subfamily G (WHITE) protein 2 (SNQ2)
VTFKRGAQASQGGDVESAASVTAVNSINELRSDSVKAEKVMATTEKMTNTLSWEGLSYTVPIGGGEERKLFSDVSGFVVPGKLTVLMGESRQERFVSPSFLLIIRPS